ncbi:MAG: hypothetical protein HW380_3421 [Magnetococcales bacterium]|nr:hypothetical protein [Magnetococcales bacterium]HIJ83495.1 flagellar protein FlgN [Magnetococcales bacterium]
MAVPKQDAPGVIKTEVDHLVAAVAPLIELYQKLSRLLDQERQSLEKRNPEQMESLAAEIGRVLEEIQVCDQLRQKITRQLGARLGLSGARLNLQSLDQSLGGGSGLLPLREQLKAEIDKAEKTNRHNQAVFKGVLTATDSMLRALKESTQGPAASYNRKGARNASGAKFHFISKQL